MESFDSDAKGVKHPLFKSTLQQLENVFSNIFSSESYDSITSEMIAMGFYEDEYGIRSIDDTHPLALVLENESTNAFIDSQYQRTLRRLTRLKMYENTGINTLDLLKKVPNYRLLELIEAVTKEASAEGKKLDVIKKGMDDSLKK